MARNSTKQVAFISSFTPRKCGIATFTSDLIENTNAAARNDFEPLVVAMRADNDLKYREPIVLRYLQELPTDQISRILGLSENTLQVRLTRARKRLRDDLAGFLKDRQ